MRRERTNKKQKKNVNRDICFQFEKLYKFNDMQYYGTRFMNVNVVQVHQNFDYNVHCARLKADTMLKRVYMQYAFYT